MAYLPPDGAVAYELNGQNVSWNNDTYLLSHIEHGIRVLAWQNTKDGEKGRNFPKAVEPTRKKEHKESYTADEINEILSRKRI